MLVATAYGGRERLARERPVLVGERVLERGALPGEVVDRLGDHAGVGALSGLTLATALRGGPTISALPSVGPVHGPATTIAARDGSSSRRAIRFTSSSLTSSMSRGNCRS